MVLDQRRITILSYLHSAKKPIDPAELATRLGVSKRTLYNDFNEIDYWLLENQVHPIKREYRKGISLTSDTKTSLVNLVALKKQWDYRFTQKERQYIIVASVLLQPPNTTAKALMDLIQVSRGTLFKDLTAVSQFLHDHHVELLHSKQDGYRIVGADYDVWRVIQKVIFVIADEDFIEVRSLLFNQVEAGITNTELQFQNEIKQLEQALSLTFNEQVATSLKLTLLFLSNRSFEKLWIEVEEQQVLLHTQAYKVVDQMAERLVHQGFRLFKQPECILFVIRLLSSRVTDIHTRDRQDEQTDVLTLTKEIIERFEYHSGVNFHEKERLYKNLVAHIKPAYYRLKYNEQLNHRYLPLIEHQLKEIYTLTEKALKPLEEYVNRPIPREEVALIAMHFGGWINRKRENRKKAYKAVVVCENGIAASSMLFSQLEVLLPEVEFLTYIPIRLFNKYEKKVDLAFSTTFISESLIPIIYVPAILGDREKAHIFRELQSFLDPERLKQSEFESVLHIIEKNADIRDRQALIHQLEPFFRPTRLRLEVYKPMLHEIVDKSMIQVQPTVSSWQEAITIAAQPLLQNESIVESYIHAMINNVTTNGPYIVIAPSIAMPHARPEEGVNKLGISILKLNEPVSFSNEAKHNAQIIIVLAAIDNETHLKALSQLSELLSEQKNVQDILASTSASQIETILHKENEGGQEQ
ncbi:BglG family transcription antiterminator [Shouchella lehensis]|uniref:BglG family transcription antiterminator n=1 Tax=Shouchella lehensis TaxID=300825 RepID=A0A4Y7WNU9_9BACI|nr:BglG family transcription antiterminator [Shouchella lehensis]MBG9784627.1 hypothetical protein [Shouchella lehensis]TES50356.1 BglG family transcription antiterminator [Shouchella lehensis]